MPIALTTPVPRTSGTTWRIAMFHFDDPEGPASSASAVFHLVDAGDNVIDSRAWAETDMAAFAAVLNAQTGTTVARVKKGILARAQAAGTLGAGVVS